MTAVSGQQLVTSTHTFVVQVAIGRLVIWVIVSALLMVARSLCVHFLVGLSKIERAPQAKAHTRTYDTEGIKTNIHTSATQISTRKYTFVYMTPRA